MGIDISSATIMGLPYDEFKEKWGASGKDEEELNNALADGEISSASPTYDAPMEEWFVGIALQDYDITPIDFVREITKQYNIFTNTFEFEPKIYGLPHVY